MPLSKFLSYNLGQLLQEAFVILDEAHWIQPVLSSNGVIGNLLFI